MFSKDFVWGVASSAYQIEGGDIHDGRGKNIWDTFTEKGGVREGENAYTACDEYHLYKEDIALMKKLGIRNYRFSLNWSRLIPGGIGAVNETGVRYYRDLLTELLSAGIKPYITLFHWEYPQALEDMGGWLNPDSPRWFAAYAKLCAERFSDLCDTFITLNEPQCFCGLGYQSGIHAPGKKLPLNDTLTLVHHVLMAHGLAVTALRENAKQSLKIGFAPTASVALPASEKPEDVEAARRMYFGMPENIQNWTWNVSWYSDPVVLGHYPEEGLKRFGITSNKNTGDGFHFTEEDMRLINQKLDFYGQNIYNGYPVYMNDNGKPQRAARKAGYPRTAAGWPVTPEALYYGPKFLYERYGLPFYITECGVSCPDAIALDGQVHDPLRIDFLHRYLLAYRRAAKEGVDIRGFFHWAFTDNFEWNDGYFQRFGLVYVDYETQKRTPKDSALWYKKVIESNGNILRL